LQLIPESGTGEGFDLYGRLAQVAHGYQEILDKDPSNPEALLGISLVAMASRQNDAAIRMAARAVQVAPQLGTAWVTLGQAMKAANRLVDAENSYRQALRLDGMNPLAHTGLGEISVIQNDGLAAIRHYEFAITKQPDMISAHLGKGHALCSLGRFEEAIECYETALRFRPRLPEAEFAIGYSLARMGNLEEGETRLRRAISQRPDFAAAWMNLGCLLREQGRDIYSEAALRRAIELRPDMIFAWINLALLKRECQKPEEAVAALRKAFELDPNHLETQIAWCQQRASENDMAGAWAWLRWALCNDPRHPEAVNMCGILLHREGRFADAVQAFQNAEALGHKAAASNRGNSLLDMGRMEEALAAHNLAVEKDPKHPGARYNLALTQIRMGDWKNGWAGYEERWHFREVHRAPRTFLQCRWQGERLHGERILLHAEQGLGDTIQMCRYATLVASRGGRPILQVQEPTMRLMESLAVVRSGQAVVAKLGEKPPEFDLEAPLLSLPAIFGTMIDTVPAQGPYLAADPELAREKLAAFPDVRPKSGQNERPLRIGFAWAGNPRYKSDRIRSTVLTTFLPLLRESGITWVSLQKGDPSKQLEDLPGEVFVWDGSSKDKDLAETAALMATLDHVITTDTCIAHLAGALGLPVWIVLPHLSDWRWMQEIETTPWYPRARLFRQKEAGNWGELMERVRGELDRIRHQGMHLRFSHQFLHGEVLAPEEVL